MGEALGDWTAERIGDEAAEEEQPVASSNCWLFNGEPARLGLDCSWITCWRGENEEN
jgi:hypothetical protein